MSLFPGSGFVGTQFPEELCLHCPDAALFLSLGALPCSALSWGWGSQGATHPAVPTGSKSPLHLTQPLLHSVTLCLGLCSSPGVSGSKIPLPDQTLPLLTTPWKCFILTMCSHLPLCYFKAKSVWTLLKPAGQELVFLKGLISHCRQFNTINVDK